MHPNPFESQLERLARTLTEPFGVLVTCQGENAWTDGRQIMLPSLPEPMDESLERITIGFLDHEMAHVAFSDFKVVGEFMKKHPGREGLLNVVEDALIERRAMERWPGVRRNLDQMFQQIRGRLVRLIKQRGPFERFCTAIYLKLAHYQDMVGLEREVKSYEDLLAQFPQVRETKDAVKLAEALLDRWLKKSHSPSQPPPRGHSQAGQKANREEPAPRGSESGNGAQEHLPDDSSPTPDPSEGPAGMANQEPTGQSDAGKGSISDSDEPGG